MLRVESLIVLAAFCSHYCFCQIPASIPEPFCGPPPIIENGETSMQVIGKDGVPVLYKITVVCNDGYKIVGRFISICVNTDTEWKNVPQCVEGRGFRTGNMALGPYGLPNGYRLPDGVALPPPPKGAHRSPPVDMVKAFEDSPCGALPIPKNVKVTYQIEELLSGATSSPVYRATYSCPRVGFQLRGLNAVQVCRQGVDNAWKQPPECIPTWTTTPCGPFPKGNGDVNYAIFLDQPTSQNADPTFRITYNCPSGYRLDGDLTEQNCTSTNEWTWQPAPKCIPSDGTVDGGDNTYVDPLGGQGTTDTGSDNVEITNNNGENTNNDNSYVDPLGGLGTGTGLDTVEITTNNNGENTDNCENSYVDPLAGGGDQWQNVGSVENDGSSELWVGGSVGPQCFENVNENKEHASCYEDGENLVRTVKVPVNEILAVHNKFRQSVDPPASTPLPDLQWDDQLAVMAERRAATCDVTSYDPDSYLEIPNWSKIGQVEIRRTDNNTWTQVIEEVANDQKVHWKPDQPFSISLRDYTQFIWADTTHVGCGQSECTDDDGSIFEIMICNYGPGANIEPLNLDQPYQI